MFTVKFSVSPNADHFKIFYAVIKFIAVFMMYLLFRSELAAKMFFHNMSMFKLPTSSQMDSHITLRRHTPTALPIIIFRQLVGLIGNSHAVTATMFALMSGSLVYPKTVSAT